ncbi:hypothetical protein BH09BAC6_BH09BAC6_07370 [soil metagenome]|jgi:hypothetical protein
MLRYLYLFLVFSMCLASDSYAAKITIPPKQKLIIKTDTASINARVFNPASLSAYGKQKEFQYQEAETSPSLWTRFWRWFWHLFDFAGKIKNSGSFFSTLLIFFEYLFLLLGIGAIIFFIARLIGVDMLAVFKGKPAAANLPYAESLENIHEIDFDAEIEKAVAQHNYRLAVRLLYLKCLKQLSDASLIQWQPDKTNIAYINELSETKQLDAFKLLTRRFEYVWYGGFVIDAPVFKQINELFQQFKNSIA